MNELFRVKERMAALGGPWLTVDEIRRQEGLPPQAAAARGAEAMLCDYCGRPAPPTRASATCPGCGASQWSTQSSSRVVDVTSNAVARWSAEPEPEPEHERASDRPNVRFVGHGIAIDTTHGGAHWRRFLPDWPVRQSERFAAPLYYGLLFVVFPLLVLAVIVVAGLR